MKRLIALAVVLALSAWGLSAISADAGVEAATGTVYANKPGKTALRIEPKLDAPSKVAVPFGQKLTIKSRTTDEPKWVKVQVPGDPASGWILANAVGERRPGTVDAQAVAAASSKIVASEATTTVAIRGLDGRTAAYAKARQISPEVLDQASRLEGFGEQYFDDHHQADAKGGWHYPDSTARGRWIAAQNFAQGEGLNAPHPPAPAATAAATPAAAAGGSGGAK